MQLTDTKSLQQFKEAKLAGITTATTLEEFSLESSTSNPIDDVLADIQKELAQVRTPNNSNSPSPTSNSKASIARSIYEQALQKSKETNQPISRKLVIEQFMKEAGLTYSGAGTYYQSMKTQQIKSTN